MNVMARCSSQGPAALVPGLGVWPFESPDSERPGAWCCEVCNTNDAVVFCKNDKAFLCDLCDYKIHQGNPLASRHEIVPLKEISAEDGLQASQKVAEMVKVEFGTEAGIDSRTATSDHSAVSSTSEHDLLKCTVDDALLEALNDPSVLEMFPGGSLDGGIEEFQDVELDSNWIETLEKEGSKTEPASPQAQAVPNQEKQAEQPEMRGADQPIPSISQPPTPDLQSLFCPQNPFGVPIPAAPHCPMPIIPFLPMGPAWNALAAGFPFTPPSLIPLQPPPTLLDRKARVARYREKRMRRTFENKIRYTSRKLYAENRPRIKGRFARPDELEAYLKDKDISGGS